MLDLNSLKNKNIYKFSELYFNYLDLLHLEKNLDNNMDLVLHQSQLNDFLKSLNSFRNDVSTIISNDTDKVYIKKYKRVSNLLTNLKDDISEKIEFINSLLEQLQEN